MCSAPLSSFISIRAPTRGATLHFLRHFRCHVFQSALPRGERLVGNDLFLKKTIFQSTLPRGERPFPLRFPRQSCYFNPRSHEGSDPYPVYQKSLGRKFQSTLPRGERPPCCVKSGTVIRFQSTLPRGERPLISFIKICLSTFQSTLPRGERRSAGALSAGSGKISIHAPTRGATLLLNSDTLIEQFQSTLPRGERLFVFVVEICNK